MKAGRFIAATEIAEQPDKASRYPCFGGNGIRGYVSASTHDGSFLLIGRQGALCGNVKRTTGRFFATEHAVVCSPRVEVNVDWAFHILNMMNLNQYATKSAQPGLAFGYLEPFRVPFPPVEVQAAIARVLDLFQSLEAELEAELGAELEARGRQYAMYRSALLNQVEQFEDGSYETLSEVVNFTNAKAHERLVDADGEIALMTSRFISTQGRSPRRVRREDVLTPAFKDQIALVMSDLPNGRALAKAFYVDADDRYAANQRVCLLQSKDVDRLLPRFLFYIVDRNPQLLAYDSGVDQTHLKKGDILGISLPLPPLAQQARIVLILDKFDSLVNDLSSGLPAELAARRQQYEYYRNKLLTIEEAA